MVFLFGALAAGCSSSDAAKDGGSGTINISGDSSVGGANGDGGTGPGCGASLYAAPPTPSGYRLPTGNLAVDAQALYWIDEGGKVLRLPKAGGPPQVLAMQAAGPHPWRGMSR